MIRGTTAIVTNGLVLCLDAANTKSYPSSGTSWFDLSGNRNTGALTNGPTFSSANGGSIVFDGVNDAVDVGNINPTSGVTFSVWININGANTNYGAIFSRWNSGSGGNSFWIGTLINESSTIQVYFNGSLIHSITSLSLNTWMLLTVSHTGSNVTSYINASQTNTNASSLRSSTGTTSIGYDINRAVEPFKGNIAQALIYDRALTAPEISQNYNATRTRFGIS
jgi:hypothetical protein